MIIVELPDGVSFDGDHPTLDSMVLNVLSGENIWNWSGDLVVCENEVALNHFIRYGGVFK